MYNNKCGQTLSDWPGGKTIITPCTQYCKVPRQLKKKIVDTSMAYENIGINFKSN